MAHLANFSEVLGCVSLLEASGNSMYIAKLCKGRTASGSACCEGGGGVRVPATGLATT